MANFTIDLSEYEDVNPEFQSNLGRSKMLDADTIKLEDGTRVRLVDLVAPEVQHIDAQGNIKKAEWGGVQLTNELASLRDQGGYTNIQFTGETDKYGRKLGKLVNADGESLGDRAVFEGVTSANGYSSKQLKRQQSLADAGAFQRASHDTDPTDLWEVSRQKLAQQARDYTMVKDGEIARQTEALDEKSLSQYTKYADDGTFGVYRDDTVINRHRGQNILGEANNAFTTGISSGMSGIHENFFGAASVIGDMINNQGLHDWGQRKAASVEFGDRHQGTFVNTIGDVSSLGDFGRYVSGMAGQSLPYLVGLMGAAAAGTFVAGATGIGAIGTAIGTGLPSLIYAGEIYNGMEGDMSEKNVALAITGGIAAATLDRLGLNKLLKASDLLKKDATLQLAKAYAKKEGIEVVDAEKIVAKALAEGQKELMLTLGGAVALKLNKTALAKVAGRSIAEGALTEGMTEAGQESLIYGAQVAGSNKEWDNEMFGDIVVNAAAGGFLLGGGISGSLGTSSSVAGFTQLQRDVGVADGTYKEGFMEGKNADEALDDVAYEELSEHGHDKEQGVKDYKEGQEADKVKNKGIIQTAKELPSRFLRKMGAILEGKYEGKVSQKALGIIHTLTANFSDSNLSRVAGVTFGKVKRQLTARLNRENRIIRQEVFNLMGVRSDIGAKGSAKSAKAASAKLSAFMNQREKVKKGELRLLDMDTDFQRDYSKWASIADRMNTLTDTSRKIVMNLSGDEVGHKANYFATAVKLDRKLIRANKDAFIALARDHLEYSEAQAKDFYEAMTEGPSGYDPKKIKRLGFNNVKEQGNLSDAVAKLEEAAGIDKFVNPDKFNQLESIFEDNINFAVDMKYLGKNGEKVDAALAALKREMGDEWDPRIATWIKDSIASQRGDYKPIKNKAWKETQAWITWFNTVTQLDTSVLASLPELATIMMGSRGKENAAIIGDATAGVFGNLRKTFNRNKAKFIKDSGYTEEEIDHAIEDFYRYGYDMGAQGALAQVDIDFGDGRGAEFRRKTMEAFFKANLLAPFTDATRISRLSMANDAIFADIDIINSFYDPNGQVTNYAGDAFARLRDLNIDPEGFSQEYKAIIDGMPAQIKEAGIDSIYKYIKENHGEVAGFMDKLDIARQSYVDNALANPNPTDRPIWYSNPHFRLLTQYQGFLSVFTAHILPRIWRNVKLGNPSARYNAVAIAATMLALGFLGQEGKDEILRDGMTPPGLTDVGYLQRGVAASGLLGTGERWMNIVHPIYGKAFRNPIGILADELGPTTGSGKKIAQFIQAAAEGDNANAALYGNKLTPGKGVVDAYRSILGGN